MVRGSARPADFPGALEAIMSLLCVIKDDTSAEIAVVGNEGVVGISCAFLIASKRGPRS